MENKANCITFQTDDGEEVEFAIMEQTTLGGTNYLLVTTGSDEEFLILKEKMTKPCDRVNNATKNNPENDAEDDMNNDDMVSYVILENEEELKSVAQVFNELLEDVDLEV